VSAKVSRITLVLSNMLMVLSEINWSNQSEFVYEWVKGRVHTLCNVDPLLNVGNNQSTPSYASYHNCFPHCPAIDVSMDSRCTTFLQVTVLPSSSDMLSLHRQILFGISGIVRNSTRRHLNVICQNNKWFPEDGSRVNYQNVVLTLAHSSQLVLSFS
jgi:hypothetical protein